jgi:peptidoglycan/LPS O-acetylase OafA/YrhL
MPPQPRLIASVWRMNEVRAIRGVLAAGAAVFAVSALVALVAPGLLADGLGLRPSVEGEWALRMVGACLVALAGQMWLVRRADAPAIRGAAVVMIVGGGLMTVLTVFLPADSGWTLVRWLYLVFGSTFVIAYSGLLWWGLRERR